jgi:hypothetical protein
METHPVMVMVENCLCEATRKNDAVDFFYPGQDF